MGIFILVVSILIIWAFLVFLLFVTISFVRYAWQEMRHEFKNVKRFAKEMLTDIEWTLKHR